MVDRDQEHLRLLTMCYYILAGSTALFSLFALIYVVFGAIIASGVLPSSQTQNSDPRVVGYILTAVGAAVFLLGMGMAVLYYLVARGLRNHRWRILCYVMAGLSCLYIPFGTAIGVCTIVVLNRPDVKNLFLPTRALPEAAL
jgi:uncharacterized BrkB/YihY/UPF0761 family membrane protein